MRFNALLPAAMLIAPLAHAQFDGFALYGTSGSTTARLINANQQIAYTWSCPTSYSYAMEMKPNGNIVRSAVYSGNQITTAAVGGRIQELNPQGGVVWDFIYSTADYVTHHDIALMPNGNVLLLAYVRHTLSQLQALGYDGTAVKYPGRIIEVQQNGSGGQVVWQWEMKDRFIQDVDPTKPNFMPIAEHPERMDINVAVSGSGGPGGGIDWFHENGVDYNEELDQIAFSARYLSEIFIIDHSITTAEAAGHTGGNGGHGGDFLFRWGKPANYGITGPQTIAAAVHDVKWVQGGAMDGWISFFNNSGSGQNSTVDAIHPTMSGYNYPWTPGTAWGPVSYAFRHLCLANASGQSAGQIMPDGNVFCAVSGEYMYEVNSSNQVVWQYNAGPQKGFRYTCDHPGIINLLNDPCGITTEVRSEEEVTAFNMYPNPAHEQVSLVGVNVETLRAFTVLDAEGRVAKRSQPGWTIDVSDLPAGVYTVMLEHETGLRQARKLVVAR